MAEYTIIIDEKTKAGQAIKSLLESLKDIVVIHKTGIEESLNEVKEGKVSYAKNAKDLISKCSE